MSKGKKRKKAQAAKVARKANIKQSGGTSKYAAKHARAVNGKFNPTSPFYLPPEKGS